MCEVADIIETQEFYKIAEATSAETNKILEVRFGKDKRKMKMNIISNANFTSNEFKQYITKL
jgi:hypothetical protein